MQATLYNYFACTSSTQRASEKFILSQEKRSTHRKRKITEASKDKEVEYDSEGSENTNANENLTLLVNKSAQHAGTPKKLRPKILQNNLSGNFTQLQTQDSNKEFEETVILDLEETTVVSSQNENETTTCLELTVIEDVHFWNVHNFAKMISFAKGRDKFKKLLSKTDLQNLANFENLREEYKYFLLKLFTYLPKWYNIHKFSEKVNLKLDKSEVTAMYKKLKDLDLIISDFKDEEPADLLNNLQLPQVQVIYKEFKIRKKKQSAKKDLIKLIIDHCNKQATITPSKTMYDVLKSRIRKLMGYCVKLHASLYKTFYKIYVMYTVGTNLFKLSDVSLFMSRVNKGEIILPEFQVQDVDLFENEASFAWYAEAHEYLSEFQTAFEKKDKKLMQDIAEISFNVLKGHSNNNTDVKKRLSAEYFYAKILCLASEHLTRTCDPAVIIDWLKLLLNLNCHRKHGFCYKQLSLIYTRYIKSNNEAAKYLLEGLRDPKLSPIELCTLKERANALLKPKNNSIDEDIKGEIQSVEIETPNVSSFKKKIIKAQAITSEVTRNMKQYKLQDENNVTTYTSVEQIAIHHYRKNGYPLGMHCEGSLITSLFGLLFWDIIYNELVADVFLTELQYLPFDLYTSDFYKNREHVIQHRLKEIGGEWELSELRNFVEVMWERHSYKRSLITMSMLDADNIMTIISCITRACLAKIFERLVRNLKEFSAGMPDLFVWNPRKMDCKFVEVKGEGDKLSMKQKFWMDFLNSIEVDAEVCLVKTLGSRRNHQV